MASPANPTESWTKEDESVRTESTYEDGREQVRNANATGLTRIQSGVDVERAQLDFAELNEQFSNISRLSKRESRASKRDPLHDIEKTGTSSTSNTEPWDLESALHGSKAAETEAGIKPKHIGRLYDLQVYGCWHKLTKM